MAGSLSEQSLWVPRPGFSSYVPLRGVLFLKKKGVTELHDYRSCENKFL